MFLAGSSSPSVTVRRLDDSCVGEVCDDGGLGLDEFPGDEAVLEDIGEGTVVHYVDIEAGDFLRVVLVEDSDDLLESRCGIGDGSTVEGDSVVVGDLCQVLMLGRRVDDESCDLAAGGSEVDGALDGVLVHDVLLSDCFLMLIPLSHGRSCVSTDNTPVRVGD